MINSPLEEIQRHHRAPLSLFGGRYLWNQHIFNWYQGFNVIGDLMPHTEDLKNYFRWIFTSGGGFSWRNLGLGDLVNSLNIWASEFKHQRYATFELPPEGWLTSENAKKIRGTDKHSFLGQENTQIIREVCAGGHRLNSFNSVLFDGNFLSADHLPSSGQLPNSVFRPNQPRMRCNP